MRRSSGAGMRRRRKREKKEGNTLYRREKNRKGILLVVGGIFAVMSVLLIALLQIPKTSVRETENGKEPEVPVHSLTIYKSAAGDVSVKAIYVEEDDDEKTTLKVPEGEMLTLSLSCNPHWNFASVEVLDHSLREVVYTINKGTDGIYRINFAMPASDVMVTFNYTPEESETMEEIEPVSERIVYLWDTEKKRETEETEETEGERREAPSETDETGGKPYGLTLHGITSTLLSAYGGTFDDLFFLQKLGEALKMEDPESPYSFVTDVYLSQEEYRGEKETGMVYTYLYFNGNPDWKLLSVYSLTERTYRFQEEAEETEDTASAEGYAETAVSSYGASAGGATGSAPSSSAGYALPQETVSVPITEEVTISLNVCGVSEAFLNHVGGQEAFYDRIFAYVASSGLTGEIASAMEGFSIDEETGNAEAAFSIQGTGQIICCAFDGKYHTLSFSGL